MKKILSLAFIALMFSGLYAQTTTVTTTPLYSTGWQKTRIGLKITPGVSWLTSDKSSMAYKLPGFTIGAGVQIEHALSKTISFVWGGDVSVHSGTVAFDQTHAVSFITYKDVTQKNDTTAGMQSRQYNFQNVDIPLCLKLKTNEIGHYTYWLQVGLLSSVMWKAHASNSIYKDANGNSSQLAGDLSNIDVKNETYLIRESLIAGAGIEYNLSGSTDLLLGLNYISGFTSTLSPTSPTLIYSATKGALPQSLFSNYIALTAGILF